LPGGDLAPATGGGAEVDHPLARLQKVCLFVDLQQLEGGPRAIASRPCLGHPGIVELPLQPAHRRRTPALRRSYPLPKLALPTPGRAATALAAATLAAPRLAGHGVRGPAKSCSIIRVSIPSRRPRSATRRRDRGQRVSTASTMAQPATTRSARCTPMQGWAARAWKLRLLTSALVATTVSRLR